MFNSITQRMFLSSLLLAAVNIASTSSILAQIDSAADWNAKAAAEYLDSRANEWIDWSGSDRDQNTSCVACHTGQPYLLARQILGASLAESDTSDAEKRVFAGIESRIANVESKTHYYQFNELKTKQSAGTESLQNALACATRDAQNDLTEISELTAQALEQMWQEQISSGPTTGAWNWLDFGLEPWEAEQSGYFGATLAANAIGIAPGYLDAQPGTEHERKDNIERLKEYLLGNFDEQHLHNQMSMLLASTSLDGLLDNDQVNKLVEHILAKQQPDGGWSLNSLGSKTNDSDYKWVRKDGTDQVDESDGYATGFAVYVLKRTGSEEPGIANAIEWLATNQNENGSWTGNSVNKKRNRATHVGKFMDDAATAYAILALLHQ